MATIRLTEYKEHSIKMLAAMRRRIVQRVLSFRRALYFGAVGLQVQIFTRPALAQYYQADEAEGPTVIQKLLTSPAASLIMVLIGSAGLFNLFFATGKGERSDRQQLFGLMCCLLVIGMCWYRFSLWNDPNFNARPH